MPAFSSGRDTVFTPAPKVHYRVHGFPDFYALLRVARNADNAELEEAITARGADLLAASFSRGVRGEFLELVQQHITDFRPILLNKVVRIAYDEQLRRHEAREARAMPFDVWKETHASGNLLQRGLHKASLGLKARLKSAFWDSEYF